MKQKSAEILCIGTELLMGNTVNTNATYIAKAWRRTASTSIIRRWWAIIHRD